MFLGFTEETNHFFLNLRFHNDVSYFKEHENEYRMHVKEPFFSFVREMEPVMRGIAEDFELRPEKCLARIRRDTRFSKDKSPFRDHLWILFRRAAEPREASVMYWFELSPEEVAWGVGFWGENRPAMEMLRNMMACKPSVFLMALKEARLPDEDLLLYGESYQRMKIPDVVPEPLHRYYTRKSLYIKRVNVPLSISYSPELITMVARDFRRLQPMYLLLRSAADEGMVKTIRK